MVPMRTGGLPDCRPLLADPDDLALVFQPVVDLAGATVAGYQALARFPGTAGPDVWFAAAAQAGLGAELEALLVHKALARLPGLPPGAFLVVPVRAALLGSGPVRSALASRPRLDGLVVELRPGVGGVEPTVLAGDLAALRARGAGLALGADQHPRSPQEVPDVVVLDGDAVRSAAGHGAALGAVPGAPRLLVDGIETPQDLTAALERSGALGRGWLFGPPSVVFEPLSSSATELLRTRRARVRMVDAVLPLVRPVQRIPASTPGVAPAVEVDSDGAPVALLVAGMGGTAWRKPISLCVLPGAGAGETLRLALSRPAGQRHDPVLCTDEEGRPLGLLRVADLVRATAP